jgi:hypothetical protein
MTLTSSADSTKLNRQGMEYGNVETPAIAAFFSFRVIIHGFWNSYNSKINKAMKKVYMTDYDVNLIIVNYSKISRDTCYKIVRSRVGLLGRKIAEFLDEILGDDEWQWSNLVIVGHSLGSHTAGGWLDVCQ